MYLSGLYRYPLKSAAGESLRETDLDALGVVGDRRWMVVDAATGRFLTQRLLPQMSQLQARWQPLALREKRMVAGMALVLVGLLIWLTLVKPPLAL